MNRSINLENKLHEYRLELLKIKVNEDSKRQDQILESIKKLKNKIKIDKQEQEELDKIPNITRNKSHVKSNIKGKKRQIFIKEIRYFIYRIKYFIKTKQTLINLSKYTKNHSSF